MRVCSLHLEHSSLDNNGLKQIGARAIAEALQVNSTLTKLQ